MKDGTPEMERLIYRKFCPMLFFHELCMGLQSSTFNSTARSSQILQQATNLHSHASFGKHIKLSFDNEFFFLEK